MSDISSVVIGAVLGSWLTVYLTGKLFEQQRFEEAAKEFRNVVYEEISELYHDRGEWNSENITLLRGSVSKVTSAAMKFKFFVKNKGSENSFDHALKCYEEFCNGHFSVEHNTSAYLMEMCFRNLPPNRGKETRRDQFRLVVDNLLSHTERKRFSKIIVILFVKFPKIHHFCTSIIYSKAGKSYKRWLS